MTRVSSRVCPVCQWGRIDEYQVNIPVAHLTEQDKHIHLPQKVVSAHAMWVADLFSGTNTLHSIPDCCILECIGSKLALFMQVRRAELAIGADQTIDNENSNHH